jgi:hypothetical protein
MQRSLALPDGAVPQGWPAAAALPLWIHRRGSDTITSDQGVYGELGGYSITGGPSLIPYSIDRSIAPLPEKCIVCLGHRKFED